MSWVETKQALERGVNAVVFAVGSNEQHGLHLPTCSDLLIDEALA